VPALTHALDRFDALSPGKVPIICDDACWTTAQLRAGSAGVASILRASGAQAGDAIWLVLPSGGSFVLSILAIERIGAVAVPFNPVSAVPELVAKALVAPPRAIILPLEADGSGFAEEIGEALAQRGMTCSIFSETDLIAKPGTARSGNEIASFGDEALALILFTSGTTGQPKGVPLTHEGLIDAAESSTLALGLRSSDEIASPLPMFHVFGLVVGLMAPWLAGAAVRTTRRFNPGQYLPAVAGRSTVLIAVPAMLAGLIAVASDGVVRTALRLVATGGSPLPQPLAERFEAKFGVWPKVGYGMTETSGVISLPRGAQDNKGCGWPIDTISVTIRNVRLDLMGPSQIGEIWVKGANVIRHYLMDGGEKKDALNAEGWFDTGDLGFIADDGEIVIVGRSKELIIRGGYNVYPAEVEQALSRHPLIRAAVVVGLPHEELGEDIAAYIVMADGAHLEVDELIAWARSQLALYKYPRSIMFVEQLPLTPAGKVMRFLLPAFPPQSGTNSP
jgi:long-chain acyl-CoA synthetase